MKFNKVLALYFSPTGNSRKCAVSTAAKLGRKVEEIDFTKISSVNTEIEFNVNDCVVFAAPVYGGRLYKEFADKIRKLNGNLAKCIVIVTYGNRDYEDALLEFKNLLIERHFIPLSLAAIVGKHTYGDIQVERPDKNDIDKCYILAKEFLNKIESGKFSIPNVKGEFPYKDGGNGGSFYPSTSSKCKKCGLCVIQCPKGAISEKDFSTIDTQKCISCFRCISVCQYDAKIMATKEYREFADMFSAKLKEPKEDDIFV